MPNRDALITWKEFGIGNGSDDYARCYVQTWQQDGAGGSWTSAIVAPGGQWRKIVHGDQTPMDSLARLYQLVHTGGNE